MPGMSVAKKVLIKYVSTNKVPLVLWVEGQSLLLAGEQGRLCGGGSRSVLRSQGCGCLGWLVARVQRRSLLGAIQLPLFICVGPSKFA